jgi:multidrug efflux pump subunit AcrA (membrane-fusion protein)
MAYQIKSFSKIYNQNRPTKIRNWFWWIIGSISLFLLLPWTQNIQTKGLVTTRFQENRPQQIQSPIAGKIVKWYVKEGDIVKKGDTILFLSEIKETYLDPNLIQRTQEQALAKKGNIDFYQDKATASKIQIGAIEQGRKLKIELLKNKLNQLKSKLNAELAEQEAIQTEFNFSLDQRNRQKKMLDEGLVSQTQFQQRELVYQNAQAKQLIIENKILQTRQEISNNQVEQNSAIQEYLEKIQKAEGDRLSSLSEANVSRADAAKLENQVANYTIRNGMYIVTAPQDGQIVQAKKSGIGEIVKEGESVTLVVPYQNNNYAVEMFVRPVDLPLIDENQKVRFLFDGFPAIVFSGWPKGSYGTFGGKIIAYENSISDNGMFRVIVVEDAEDRKWPKQIKVGTGAQSIVLLKTVPIWYELWRNINGFPPDYYKSDSKKIAK